jgi:predicted acylesterase/phospholipase RssA
MVKRLAIGPGAMGFYMYLGALSKLKNSGQLDELEEISGASAGGLLGFMFCLLRGDVSRILEYSLAIPVKQLMKPNIKNFLKSYGLVSTAKIRDVLSEFCFNFTTKSDVTFKELYELWPVKLHISGYCVDLMKTTYFSVDTAPDMSVLDAVCATIAIPFLFSSLQIGEWNYIDGGSAETTPSGPFIGKDGVFAMRLGWTRIIKVKDILTYALNVVYLSMKLRHEYDVPTLSMDSREEDVYDFGSSSETKLRMFVTGFSQQFSF